MTSVLSAKGLGKNFGGVVATDIDHFELRAGELHAIIGPNGAGKTTLLAQLAGELMPDRGTITFESNDITGWAPRRRSRAGIARSFQITSVIADIDVLGNVLLAVQPHNGHSYRFWRNAYSDTSDLDLARNTLSRFGLLQRQDDLAGVLSHGEQRQLEVAMAVASSPTVLLLDEPMAGLGIEESAQMMASIGSLRGRSSIVLIEHDMDAVFAMADRISVLVEGRVIATGAPGAIRTDRDVAAAYLGEAGTC